VRRKSLIQRVAAASTEEINRAILDLQRVRDVLRREGEQSAFDDQDENYR